MTVPTLNADYTGNTILEDGARLTYDSQLSKPLASASQPYILAGTGAPTFAAPQGSLYTNLTGSSTSTRLYVNTNGSTTWTNVTTAA